MAIPIKATARDFNFTLDMDNACNCSCFKRKYPAKNTRVYFHSNGRVELFSSKKAQASASNAFQRSLSNLKGSLYMVAVETGHRPEELIAIVEGNIGISLSHPRPSPVNCGQLSKINSVLSAVLSLDSLKHGEMVESLSDTDDTVKEASSFEDTDEEVEEEVEEREDFDNAQDTIFDILGEMDNVEAAQNLQNNALVVSSK